MSTPRRYTDAMTASKFSAKSSSQSATQPDSRRLRCTAALSRVMSAVSATSVMLAALAPVAFLAACSSSVSPEVSLVGARFVERTSDATLLELELDAANAGSEPLKLRDIEYEARTNTDTFTATRSAQAVIPPFSSRRVVLPVAIPRDLGDGPYTLTVQGRMLYVPNSVIRDTMTDLGWPSPSSPIAGDAVAEANAAAATPPQGQ